MKKGPYAEGTLSVAQRHLAHTVFNANYRTIMSVPIGDAAGVKIVNLMPLHTISAAGQLAMVSMTYIKAVVHLPAEVLRPLEPRPRSSEDPMRKPRRPIVVIGSAVIRRVIIVSVRTRRRGPNLHRRLSVGTRRIHQQQRNSNHQHANPRNTHIQTLFCLEPKHRTKGCASFKDGVSPPAIEIFRRCRFAVPSTGAEIGQRARHRQHENPDQAPVRTT